MFFLFGLAVFWNVKPLKKFDIPFYFITLGLCIESSVQFILHTQGKEIIYPKLLDYLIEAIDKGIFATALFVWIMLAGTLPSHWRLRKNLMIARGELSILASILTMPHILHYVFDFIAGFERLGRLKGLVAWGTLTGFIAGMVAFLIMLPLFVTSFRRIRKKMPGKKWKALQEYAYVFYGLVYLHILAQWLAKAPDQRDMLAMLSYTAVFIAYGGFRLKKHGRFSKKLLVVKRGGYDAKL